MLQKMFIFVSAGEKWKYRKTSCQTKKEPHLEHEKTPWVNVSNLELMVRLRIKLRDTFYGKRVTLTT